MNAIDALRHIKDEEERQTALPWGERPISSESLIWARPISWKKLGIAIFWDARVQCFMHAPMTRGRIPARLTDAIFEEWEVVTPNTVNDGA